MKTGSLSLRTGSAVAAMAVSLTLALPALAQSELPNAQPSTATNDGEIIVTARRRNERLLDAPVAISAVSGATLSQYQVTRVADIATLVPSLVAGRAGSGSAASIFLRGVGSSSLSAGFDQSVSFVIDGLAMSRGREISLPQFDVQRVEVLKGPQALFFGKNTTGGLISITTNGPTDHFEAGIKAGYGFRAEEKYTEAYVSGPITSTLQARLAMRYSDSNGAFTNTAADQYTNYVTDQYRTRNASHRGYAESFGARATVAWQPSPDLSFQLKAGLSMLNDGGASDLIERICGGGRTTPSAAAGRAPSPNADCAVNGRSDSAALPIQVAQGGYRYAGDGHLYTDFDSQYAVLTGTATLNPFTVTSISGFYHFRQTDLNNVSGEAYPAGYSQYTDFTQYSEELRFQSQFAGPLNLLFGGFYAHGKFTFNTDGYISPVAYDLVNQTYATFKRDNGFATDSFSLFGEATLKIGEKIELSGGARYSMEERASYQRSLAAHSAFAATYPGGIVLKDHYTDDNLSPQVTLRYKPDRNTSLYAAYKQGFKAGGYNISQALTPAATVDKGRYGSETAEGFEAGIRTIQLGGRLNLNLTAYRYVYSDLQVQYFDPTIISLTAGNAGKLRTQGLEGDFNYRIGGGFSVHGAAAYNDAEYQDYIGQCYSGQTQALGCNLQTVGGVSNAQDYSGRTPPKAPKYAGRLGAAFDRDIGSSGMTLRLSADASTTSRYNYTDALRPDAVQKGFVKFDASASLSGPDDRWKLSLIGRNLTNRLVVTSAADIPFTGGTGTGTTGTGVLADMSAFVDNPREVFLEMAVKF